MHSRGYCRVGPVGCVFLVVLVNQLLGWGFDFGRRLFQ